MSRFPGRAIWLFDEGLSDLGWVWKPVVNSETATSVGAWAHSDLSSANSSPALGQDLGGEV